MDGGDAIRLANSEVSIIKACNMVGLDIGEFAVASLKLYCPFGQLYHEDGGSSRAMRVYPGTNSAYCFAGCGYFSPVKLVAMDRDMTEEAAAEYLLEEIGWVAPTYEAQWEALMAEKPVVDTASLAEALKVACSRMSPRWEALQFEEVVSTKLSQCFALLGKVHSEEDAQKWLGVTKQVMAAVIGVRT